jgi:hypothetical protein
MTRRMPEPKPVEVREPLIIQIRRATLESVANPSIKPEVIHTIKVT